MSIARINEMFAQKGHEDELSEFIAVVVRPYLERSPGCLSCLSFRSRENPSKFVVIEQWESAESQRASMLATPPEQTRHLRVLLASGGSATLYDPLQ
jgi:quinol monooxygenase YgiN